MFPNSRLKASADEIQGPEIAVSWQDPPRLPRLRLCPPAVGRIGPVIAEIVPGTTADSEQVVAVRRRHRVAGQIGLEAQVGKCRRGTAVIAEPRAQPRRELRRRLLEPVKVILPHDARGIEVEGDVVAEHPRVGEIQQVAGAAAKQRVSGEEDITPERFTDFTAGPKDQPS